MSRFSNWKACQVSRSLMPFDNIRAPRERRKENKKEALFEEQPQPLGQRLPKGEGAQIAGDETRDAGADKAVEDGAPLSKRESRKDARGTDWKLPVPLGPVYPPLVSTLSSVKALGRSWELSPPTTNRFRIHDVHAARLPQQGPFQNFMDMKAEKRLAGRKERRSCFGDINTHKCYQFGQIFCPFQALATTGFYFTYLHFVKISLKSGVHDYVHRPAEEVRKVSRSPSRRTRGRQLSDAARHTLSAHRCKLPPGLKQRYSSGQSQWNAGRA